MLLKFIILAMLFGVNADEKQHYICDIKPRADGWVLSHCYLLGWHSNRKKWQSSVEAERKKVVLVATVSEFRKVKEKMAALDREWDEMKKSKGLTREEEHDLKVMRSEAHNSDLYLIDRAQKFANLYV